MSASSPAEERVGVALIGSTGSIGRQAVEVLSGLADRFRVVALATGSTVDVLSEQALLLRPDVVAVADPSAARGLDLPPGTTLTRGDDALVELATRPDVDLVVVGSGGLVSLRPVLAALAAGKAVATANKETLVAGGHLVMPLARALAGASAARGGRSAGPGMHLLEASQGDPYASPLAWLRPIDSEHSAIWQCLVGEPSAAIARLVLTASGGPFLDTPADELAFITPERALRHPTWRMGAKITIDSATLANKGLEVIEAHWLYDVGYDAIEVVIHPQSVVHSAVRFVDGSLKAQLGTPDMRLPIQYALTYPERLPSPAAPPDLLAVGRLEFRAPDESRFPALPIAREAGRRGPAASAALIAADEVAVARFLDGTLAFPAIPRLLEAAVERFGRAGEPDLDALLALEADVRAFAVRWTAGAT